MVQVPPELLHLCPWCEQEVPERDWAAHGAGLDAQRLACPHQDLEAIVAARARRARGLAGVRW